MADPTPTVTNLGDQGVDEVLGVIYGHTGAQFLSLIDRLLQSPEDL